MTVQEHDANNIRDAEASTEEPVAADRRAARSLSALLLLAFLAAALLFVAGAMGVLFVDLIQLIPAQTEELIATTALHGGVALVAAIMYAWSHRLQRVASLWPRLMLAVLVVYGALTVDRGLAVVYPRPDKHGSNLAAVAIAKNLSIPARACGVSVYFNVRHRYLRANSTGQP